MPVNYPPSPTDGQIVEGDGRQYKYDAAKKVWGKYGSSEPGASINIKPTVPQAGTLFYDTTAQAGIEIYDDVTSAWINTDGGGGGSVPSATVTTEGIVFGATADFTGPGPFAIAALGTNISPNITGLGNTLIGYAAGEDLTSGGSNTLIGSAAGANVTTAGQMTLVGQNSGSSLFTQTGCTMLGRWNGTGVGDNIVALSDGLAAVKFYANSDGAWAAPTNTTTVPTDFGTAGQVLTSAGAAAPPTWETPTAPAPATATPTTYGTLYGFTDYNNSNTFLGGSAGELATTTSFNNICIGNNAAYSLTTGNENTIVGDYAAQNLSTGDGNVIIGQFAAPVLASGAAATNITSVGYTGFTAIPDESVILGSRTNVRFFANGSGAWSTDGTFTSFGTSGQVLTSLGSSAAPVWADVPAPAPTSWTQQTAALTSSPTSPSFTGIPTTVTEIKIVSASLAAFTSGDFPCFQLGTGGAPVAGGYSWALNGDFGTPPQQEFDQANTGDNKFVIYPANSNDIMFVNVILTKLSDNIWQQFTTFNSADGSSNRASGTVQGIVSLPGPLDSLFFIASTGGNGLFFGNTPNPVDTNIHLFYK